MTRERWILSAASLFALWLIGALVILPRMERDLAIAAQDMLAQQSPLLKRLGQLHLVFDGQQARLTGSVRTVQDRSAVEAAVRDLVRAPALVLGSSLNPVSGVHNAVEVAPYPAGWMLLAAKGAQARLLGAAASAYEARDLARSVQESWSAQGGTTEGMPEADAEHHDEASTVSATLRGVPAPVSTAQAYLTRIGQAWQAIDLSRTDAELQTGALALGVRADEWQSQILPVVHELRDTLQQQRRTQAESERLARLPPGHLFIAVRDQQIILRGEVGSAAMKESILNDALTIFAPRRLHDEIRVSAQRRPSGDFGPITAALLPEEKQVGAKSCFLSLSGEAWKPVDWQITPKEQSWRKELPAGLDARLLLNDSVILSRWLEGDDTNSPAPSQPVEPAFISLVLFDSKAIISGQIAEESAREQLIAAARLAYGSQYVIISDDIHVRGNCEPADNILHTLKSLPPPPDPHSAGLFAIAKPGSTWTLLPVTRELVEAGGLAKSHLLPEDIPAVVVENLTAEAIEQLRQHLAPPVSR